MCGLGANGSNLFEVSDPVPMRILSMHLSMSSPTPLPRGLTYFYRGFDNEYCPNPGDIDIFSLQPIVALKFNLCITFYTFQQKY